MRVDSTFYFYRVREIKVEYAMILLSEDTLSAVTSMIDHNTYMFLFLALQLGERIQW